MALAEASTIPAPFVMTLGASATLADAASLRTRIIEALDGNASVAIDLGALEHVDTTLVQLLASARKSAERSAKIFSICSSRGKSDISFIARASVRDAELPPFIELSTAVRTAEPIDPIQGGHPLQEGANELEDIDDEALGKLSDEIGDAALRQSLGVFFVQMTSRLEVLRGMVDARDITLIHRETHLLKGTSGTFGLRGFRSAVISFERDAGALSAQSYVAAIDRLADMLKCAQAHVDAKT